MSTESKHTPTLDNLQYDACNHTVHNLAEVVAGLDYLPTMLERMDRSESIAPMLDPTLWLRNKNKFDYDHAIAKAAATFRAAVMAARAKAAP